MGTVLLTGASGFVGSRLLPRLSGAHEVITLSRSPIEADGVTSVRGDFTSAADLRQLDGFRFDTVVHLAAVLFEACEEECLAVNLVGAARLARYAVECGCRHLVLASSVAATGCMSARFLPRELPIGDDHPRYPYDHYGMSKALLEEQAYFLQRQHPDLEIVLLRIGGVVDAGEEHGEEAQGLRTAMPFLFGGLVHSERVVEDLALAAGGRLGPGVHRFNSVDPELSGTELTAVEELREALGERAAELDLGYFAAPGRERASYYVTESLRRAYEQAPTRTSPAVPQ